VPGDTVNQAHYTHYQTTGGKKKSLDFRIPISSQPAGLGGYKIFNLDF